MLEARSEADIDGLDLVWETVASDDNLLVELVKIIEDVEKFLLGLFLTNNELKIVDNEAVELLEFVVEFVALAFADGFDEI